MLTHLDQCAWHHCRNANGQEAALNLDADISPEEMQMMKAMGIPFGFDTTQVGFDFPDSLVCFLLEICDLLLSKQKHQLSSLPLLATLHHYLTGLGCRERM